MLLIAFIIQIVAGVIFTTVAFKLRVLWFWALVTSIWLMCLRRIIGWYVEDGCNCIIEDMNEILPIIISLLLVVSAWSKAIGFARQRIRCCGCPMYRPGYTPGDLINLSCSCSKDKANGHTIS